MHTVTRPANATVTPTASGGATSRGLLAMLALAATAPAWAGRPLAVDDANTNDAGRGHLEVWATRVPGSTVLTLAPAYAVIDGLELGAAYARENGTGLNATTLQLKWRITASQDDGCNLGMSLGTSKASQGGVRVNFVNGLGTCNGVAGGSVHVNLGQVKASGVSAIGTWGVAYERPMGAVTPHIEWFGSEGAKPTVQIGLRGDVASGWQLDGTVGRGDGQNVYTPGFKRSF